MPTAGNLEQFWSLAPNDLMAQLGAAPGGLNSAEAKRRLLLSGPNRLHTRKRTDVLILLLAQFKSPLILILLGAVILSFFLGETVDAAIIVAIVLLSSVLGFWQEKRAADAVKSLLAIVRIESRVVRDGVETDVPAEEIVPGDVCVLSAGDIIPGDAMILVCLSGEQTRKPSLQRTLGLNARCQRDSVSYTHLTLPT